MRLIDADAFKWRVIACYGDTEVGQIAVEWINGRLIITDEELK